MMQLTNDRVVTGKQVKDRLTKSVGWTSTVLAFLPTVWLVVIGFL